MHIKIAKKKKERTQKTIKYRKPTEQQQELYNEEVQKRVSETDWNGIESPFEKWAEIILAAAEATLSVVSPKQKQPYISEETWNLMELKWKKNEEGDSEQVKALSSETKTNY